jgi:branched-chain amino acid transport system substrate-binding protein
METRPDEWVGIVLIGVAIAAVLAAFSVRTFLRALPHPLTLDLRTQARAHRRSAVAGGTLIAGALVLTLLKLPGAVSETVTIRETVDGAPTAEVAGDVAVGPDGTTTGPAAGSVPGRTSTASTVPLAPVVALDLFSADQDRVGITADTIKICGHAPLSLGAVLNTKVEDLLVYWRYRNDLGGIHGRRVEVSLEDDQYSASGGVPAAQRCAERDPFLLFGAVGSDVTPPVRAWAEQHKMLYLYGFSARAGSEDLRYSYTATISQEDLSRVLADVATTRFPGQPIGLLWRNSSNVQPGRDAFRRQVESRGGEIVADLPVQQAQGNYTQEIIELQQAGAEVVMILDDALSQTNVMLQGSSQGYTPHWVVFAFNLQADTLGDAALDPPLTGTNVAPAYTAGEYSGPFAPYADELRAFEAAYAKYSPSTDLEGPVGDIAWQTWNGFAAIATLLESCGPDCSRNRFAGMLEAGYVSPPSATCPLDFRADGHHGGKYADLYETYRRADGSVAWRTYERCASAG